MPKPSTSKPTASEYTSLIDYLAACGFIQAELESAMGKTVNNRSREQIALILNTKLKTLKKKK